MIHHGFRIKTQYFLSFFSTALLCCSLLTGLFYAWFSSSLLERETSFFQTQAENIMQMTDNNIQNLNSVSQNFGFSDLSKEYLFEYFRDSTSSGSILSISKLFTAMNGTDCYAHHISIYDLNGNAVSVGVYTNTYQVDLSELEWIDELQNGQSRVITNPYYTNAFTASGETYKWYLSICRPLMTKFGTLAGYTETVQSCKTIFLDLISESKKNPDMQIYVFDGDGTLIYPFDSVTEEEREQYHDYWEQISGDTSSDLSRNPYTGQKELVVSSCSSQTGWTYICTEPQDVILASMETFRNLIAVVILLCILLSFLLSYVTSRQLTKPIHQLLSRVRRTGLDTLGQTDPQPLHFSIEELEELNLAYSETTSRLKESLDNLLESRKQELKSRRFALQFQINPHFYYNSLSSIMILAEEGETDSIIAVSQKLSQILHYATQSKPMMVMLADELDYIKKYLYCLKVRYQSSFSYQLEVPQEMMDTQVPRLIIQPLVENCMKYGNNCQPPWEISILGEYTEQTWEIHISDNGPGFTREALEKIRGKIRSSEEHPGMPDISIGGMGLLNVYLRWKLIYQDQMIFRCENLPSGGSCVTLGFYRYVSTEEEFNQNENS